MYSLLSIAETCRLAAEYLEAESALKATCDMARRINDFSMWAGRSAHYTDEELVTISEACILITDKVQDTHDALESSPLSPDFIHALVRFVDEYEHHNR